MTCHGGRYQSLVTTFRDSGSESRIISLIAAGYSCRFSSTKSFMAPASFVISVEGLGQVTKKWTRLSVTGKRPTKKSSPLRRRNSVANGCPWSYLVNPRRTVRRIGFGTDSPRY
uniref:Uncharacterized protein n=1 Tax=Arundo donax TaxID=35708 RepID=A0A0A8ZU52_ARUDO